MKLSSIKLAALGAAVVAFGIPMGAAAHANEATATNPKAGQSCKPKSKAPKGFKCVKGKDGKYTLVKG
jgi:hypothetical protein